MYSGGRGGSRGIRRSSASDRSARRAFSRSLSPKSTIDTQPKSDNTLGQQAESVSHAVSAPFGPTGSLTTGFTADNYNSQAMAPTGAVQAGSPNETQNVADEPRADSIFDRLAKKGTYIRRNERFFDGTVEQNSEGFIDDLNGGVWVSYEEHPSRCPTPLSPSSVTLYDSEGEVPAPDSEIEQPIHGPLYRNFGALKPSEREAARRRWVREPTPPPPGRPITPRTIAYLKGRRDALMGKPSRKIYSRDKKVWESDSSDDDEPKSLADGPMEGVAGNCEYTPETARERSARVDQANYADTQDGDKSTPLSSAKSSPLSSAKSGPEGGEQHIPFGERPLEERQEEERRQRANYPFPQPYGRNTPTYPTAVLSPPTSTLRSTLIAGQGLDRARSPTLLLGHPYPSGAAQMLTRAAAIQNGLKGSIAAINSTFHSGVKGTALTVDNDAGGGVEKTAPSKEPEAVDGMMQDEEADQGPDEAYGSKEASEDEGNEGASQDGRAGDANGDEEAGMSNDGNEAYKPDDDDEAIKSDEDEAEEAEDEPVGEYDDVDQAGDENTLPVGQEELRTPATRGRGTLLPSRPRGGIFSTRGRETATEQPNGLAASRGKGKLSIDALTTIPSSRATEAAATVRRSTRISASKTMSNMADATPAKASRRKKTQNDEAREPAPKSSGNGTQKTSTTKTSANKRYQKKEYPEKEIQETLLRQEKENSKENLPSPFLKDKDKGKVKASTLDMEDSQKSPPKSLDKRKGPASTGKRKTTSSAGGCAPKKIKRGESTSEEIDESKI